MPQPAQNEGAQGSVAFSAVAEACLTLLVAAVAMMGSDQHASNGLRQMLQSASIFHFHTPTACQRKYFSFIAT
jgi:hypothetical protein